MLRLTFFAALLLLVAAQAIAGPLHDAVRSGSVEDVKSVLASGADPDALGERREPALNLAILGNRATLVPILLDSGANPSVRNRGGFTPLHAAAYAGSPEVAIELLERGVDLDDNRNKSGVTPLVVAVEEGQLDVVRILIDRGARTNVLENNGYSPLTRAVFTGNVEMIRLLKDAGAECQSADVLGEVFHAKCVE
jgi:ankyrin repeat protein